MKRLCTLLFTLALLISSILPITAGYFYVPKKHFSTEESFLNEFPNPDYIFGKEKKHSFVYYDQISMLGDLGSITVYLNKDEDKPVSYEYYMLAENGFDVHALISSWSTYDENEHSDIFLRDSHNATSLSRIDKADIKNRTETDAYWHALEVNGAMYLYSWHDSLSYLPLEQIVIRMGDYKCTITAYALSQYPLGEELTFIDQLLDLETAPDAIDELRAQLKPRMASWVLPTAIGGAVLLAIAAIAAIITIRRKRQHSGEEAELEITAEKQKLHLSTHSKRIICIILAFLLVILAVCAALTLPSQIMHNYLLSHRDEARIRIYQNDQSTSYITASRALDPNHGDEVKKILTGLANLKPTGKTQAKISDTVLNDEYTQISLPDDANALYWIEIGDLIYRIGDEIALVETHLGEGRVMECDETFYKYLIKACQARPRNYADVTYDFNDVKLDERGYAIPNKFYKSFSEVDIYIIGLGPATPPDYARWDSYYTVYFDVVARVDYEGTLRLESYQSMDNRGSHETFELNLKAGETAKMSCDVFGWDIGFGVDISAANTYVMVHFNNMP